MLEREALFTVWQASRGKQSRASPESPFALIGWPSPLARIVIVPSLMDRYKAAKLHTEIGIANERRVR
jgi:hypothetical protein